MRATHPVHLLRFLFGHHYRPTTCKRGFPDEDVSDSFGVRLHTVMSKTESGSFHKRTERQNGDGRRHSRRAIIVRKHAWPCSSRTTLDETIG